MLPLLLPLLLPFNTNAIVVKKSSCKTAVDCSYSGECIHGVCKCNVQWSGPNCTKLNLMPSLSINAAGMRRNTSSSWGGGVIWDAKRQRWSMVFADMISHCGLKTWKTNSRIVMATNDSPTSPTGPFNFFYNNSASIIMPFWSHNPTIHGPINQSNNVNNNEVEHIYLIYHIGDGHKSVIHGSPRTDCKNGTTPTSSSDIFNSNGRRRRNNYIGNNDLSSPVPYPPFVLPKVVTPNILVSNDINGPWKPYKWGKDVGWSCNNPGATFLKNGTVILVCKVLVTQGPEKGLPWRQMAIYAAPSWDSPYKFQRLTPVYGEDGYIWYDPKADGGTGAFHMLLHAMRPVKIPTTAWSKDGLDWIPNGYAGPSANPQPRSSFNYSIAMRNGDVLRVQRRERHQPIFKDGKLIGLCNGVTTVDRSDYSFTACVPVKSS